MYNPKLHFHFTGIGGYGMSGIAEVLLNLGFRVSGTDLKMSSVTERLTKLGAVIYAGHDSSHLAPDCSLLVYSTAVSPENPELLEAKRRKIPVIRRAEVLAELMRLKYGVAVAGSHGKTTTTSMIGHIMEVGGMDPTVIIGGQLTALGWGGKLGKSDFLVAESDESDKSFLLLKPTVAVVTNIDNEHLGAYSSFTELEQSFAQFISALPFYGLGVFCIDDARVRSLYQNYQGRKVSYGLSPDADYRADDITFQPRASTFSFVSSSEKQEVNLALIGQHMVINSLAAIAVGLEFGLEIKLIAEALSSFPGVQRRLEIIGECNGVTIINDYAHHPTEIKASLNAVRTAWGSKLNQLHVIFQPHRYSRTRDCFVDFLDAFAQADNVILSEIYPANEEPIEGVSGQALFQAIKHPSLHFVSEPDNILPGLYKDLKAGDVVVCLGAGSIGTLAEKIYSGMQTTYN